MSSLIMGDLLAPLVGLVEHLVKEHFVVWVSSLDTQALQEVNFVKICALHKKPNAFLIALTGLLVIDLNL